MSHWSEGLDDWISSLDGRTKVLVASDFDGTLSPLERRPPDATLAPGASAVLERFAKEHSRLVLAFLSGREMKDLRGRLGTMAGRAIVAGNHGLEIRGLGLDWTHEGIATLRPALELLGHDLDRELGGIPGVEVEDKKLSLSLHYRRLEPSLAPAFRERVRIFPIPKGLARHEGKMVFEFRPVEGWNKGAAIRAIMDHFSIRDSAAIYLGDDTTDEDVFNRLDGSAFTVHVGEAMDRSKARFFAHHPADVVKCLEAIAEALGSTPTQV